MQEGPLGLSSSVLTASVPRGPSFYLWSVVQTHLLWVSTPASWASPPPSPPALLTGHRPREALQDQQEHPPDPDHLGPFPLVGHGRHLLHQALLLRIFCPFSCSQGSISTQGPCFLQNAAPSQRPPCWPRLSARHPKPDHSSPWHRGALQNSTRFVISPVTLPRLALVEGGSTGARAVSVSFPRLLQTRQRLLGTRGCWLVGQPDTPYSALRWIFLSCGGPSDCCSPW